MQAAEEISSWVFCLITFLMYFNAHIFSPFSHMLTGEVMNQLDINEGVKCIAVLLSLPLIPVCFHPSFCKDITKLKQQRPINPINQQSAVSGGLGGALVWC